MHEESGPSWGMRGLRKWLGTAPETRDELLKLVQDSRRFLEPDTWQCSKVFWIYLPPKSVKS